MLEPGMGLIGLRLFIGGSLAWILNRHSADNHQHLGQTPLLIGGEQHAPQPGVDRQACEPLSERSEFAPRRHRAQFF